MTPTTRITEAVAMGVLVPVVVLGAYVIGREVVEAVKRGRE
jgi:hypothetical protein